MDLILWWLAYVIVVGLVPAVLVLYLYFPARTRQTRTDGVIRRIESAVASAPDKTRAVLAQVKESTYQRIQDSYRPRNYTFPILFLALVLAAGFFLMFSVAHPLYKLQALDDSLLNVPATVFFGFAGGWFFALYSAVNRYRSADVPPGLVLQLAYQILVSAGVAYFAATLAPTEYADPGVAFAAGFVPYGEIVSWLRVKAQSRLGTAPGAGAEAEAERPFGTDNLSGLQGLSSRHRERLGEEEILTVQNLAFANPLVLHLTTPYSMALIVDRIDQAYLRMYVGSEAASRLAVMGIRGAIELGQANDSLSAGQGNGNAGLLPSLATALGSDEPGTRNFIEQMAGDPQVQFLERMWSEFGGT